MRHFLWKFLVVTVHRGKIIFHIHVHINGTLQYCIIFIGMRWIKTFLLQDKTPYDLAVENKNMYDAELILMARQKTNPRGLKEYLTRSPVSWQ